MARAHQERPDGGAPVSRHQPHPDMGIGDYGVGGHEDHITQEGDGGAQAHGGTVHRGDDGDFHIHQIPDELFGVPPEMIETFGVSERGKPSEVPSR